MEKGSEYFSGKIDLGILGNVNIAIFENESKEKENQPDFFIISDENRVGALWRKQKK